MVLTCFPSLQVQWDASGYGKRCGYEKGAHHAPQIPGARTVRAFLAVAFIPVLSFFALLGCSDQEQRKGLLCFLWPCFGGKRFKPEHENSGVW